MNEAKSDMDIEVVNTKIPIKNIVISPIGTDYYTTPIGEISIKNIVIFLKQC